MKENTKDMETEDENIEKRINDALKIAEIPNIHCNGFVNSLGTGDVLIILESNKKPVATLNMSYTVAKTFAIKLIGLIENLEQKSGTPIMTTEDIMNLMSLEAEHEENQ